MTYSKDRQQYIDWCNSIIDTHGDNLDRVIIMDLKIEIETAKLKDDWIGSVSPFFFEEWMAHVECKDKNGFNMPLNPKFFKVFNDSTLYKTKHTEEFIC